MLVAIVAVDNTFGIGYQGTMPWTNKEDLNHFKTTTMGHKVIMGYTTYRNLNHALEGRELLVVTSSHKDEVSQSISIEDCISLYKDSEEIVYVAGGASIYQSLLQYCDKVLLSRIDGQYVVDTYFPDEELRYFKLIDQIPHDTFQLLVYVRK